MAVRDFRASGRHGQAEGAYRSDAFGQRGGRIKHPLGTIWWVVSCVEDISEDEMWRRLQDPAYAEVMRVAQETLDAELRGRCRGPSSALVKTCPTTPRFETELS